MAFFMLFTGLLLGTSLVALSESEREYYYANRSVSMAYLGNRDGYDVYRDNFNGQFYIDDGWEVRRVGTAGFVPHPVERLTELCQRFNPQNLPWVDFLLASFEGKEQQLWKNFFEKYELGPKPKEPTWGKGIRKARWADYGRQLDAWEEKRSELTPKFEQECARWNAKRRHYDETHQSQVSEAAGRALLQRALSGGATVIHLAPVASPATTSMLYRATVPAGSRPGETFMVNAAGQTMSVTVPPGAYPGQEITFQGPPVKATVVDTKADSYSVPSALAVPAPIGAPTQQPSRPSVPPPAVPPASRPPSTF